MLHETQKIILCQVRFHPCKLGKLNFLKKMYEFFKLFQSLVHSEVKKIISIKSSLREVRFNPREVRFTSHQSDSSLSDICLISR